MAKCRVFIILQRFDQSVSLILGAAFDLNWSFLSVYLQLGRITLRIYFLYVPVENKLYLILLVFNEYLEVLLTYSFVKFSYFVYKTIINIYLNFFVPKKLAFPLNVENYFVLYEGIIIVLTFLIHKDRRLLFLFLLLLALYTLELHSNALIIDIRGILRSF